MKTVIIQSYRTKSVPKWINLCLKSVQAWASSSCYEYKFFGDVILNRVPNWYKKNSGNRLPVITDLGRLLLIEEELAAGADRAIWLDADVLVFDPESLIITEGLKYAFGREFWVQLEKEGPNLKVYRNVHNAICLFEKGNPFLKFYIHASKHIISKASGKVPNQVVGPKFLTAIHNLMGFNLINTVGMASPLVLQDIANKGGPALERLKFVTPKPLASVNLCSSLIGIKTDGVVANEKLMMKVCNRLLQSGLPG